MESDLYCHDPIVIGHVTGDVVIGRIQRRIEYTPQQNNGACITRNDLRPDFCKHAQVIHGKGPVSKVILCKIFRVTRALKVIPEAQAVHGPWVRPETPTV